jgi:hypothetical protein
MAASAPPAKGKREKLPHGRPTKLTPERHTDIVELIKHGAFEWVAAEACGIHRDTFTRWMMRGERAASGPHLEDSDPDLIYLRFFEAVQAAAAYARVTAEIEVRAQDPKWWLTRGPGKTKPGKPGWTETIVIDEGRVSKGTDEDGLTIEERLARVGTILTKARGRAAKAEAEAQGEGEDPGADGWNQDDDGGD